jgi:hypothetical protein
VLVIVLLTVLVIVLLTVLVNMLPAVLVMVLPPVSVGLVWTRPLLLSRHGLPQNHPEQVWPLRGVGPAGAVAHVCYA